MSTRRKIWVATLMSILCVGCDRNRFSPGAQSPNIRFDNVTGQNCWAGSAVNEPISEEQQKYLNDLLMRTVAQGKSAEEAGQIQNAARKSMTLPLCVDLAKGH
jgi:hypothetical protein